MPGVGILESKETPTTGTMIRLGCIDGLYSGFDVLKPLVIGRDGRLTQTLPVADPGELMRIQKFGFAIDPGCVCLTGEIGSVITRRG
jgi:hypothetical protein